MTSIERNDLFLDFSPESFCSSDKISDLGHQSPSENVALMHEFFHLSGSIFWIYVISQKVKRLTDS